MLEVLVRLTGAALLGLGLLHAAFPRRFSWKEELQNISLLTRQIFYVHHFFIALICVLQGILCGLYAPLLLDGSPLARVVSTGLSVFWAFRLLFQFWVYDSELWRGKRFETSIHLIFAATWLGLTALFAAVALR